jgi:hypothetical protein
MIVLYIDPGTSEFLFHIERYVICPVDLWTESPGGKLDVTCPVRRKTKKPYCTTRLKRPAEFCDRRIRTLLGPLWQAMFQMHGH